MEIEETVKKIWLQDQLMKSMFQKVFVLPNNDDDTIMIVRDEVGHITMKLARMMSAGSRMEGLYTTLTA